MRVADNERIYSESLFVQTTRDHRTWKHTLLDYSSEDLVHINRVHLQTLKAATDITDMQEKLQRLYSVLFAKKEQERIAHILDKRNALAYTSPVAGMSIPTYASWIPNARRSYRAHATDGIHHSWDFYAPLYTPVVAVEEALVIRVVRGFEWSWFDRINTHDHSPDTHARNLDIYR